MRWTALLVVLLCFYGGFTVLVCHAPGLWQDDGIYLATAKSLATGAGYRHIELPGEPWQTKYPIFYPAILAGMFLLWPEYPQNVSLLLLPSVIAAAAFVSLSIGYLETYKEDLTRLSSRLLANDSGAIDEFLAMFGTHGPGEAICRTRWRRR